MPASITQTRLVLWCGALAAVGCEDEAPQPIVSAAERWCQQASQDPERSAALAPFLKATEAPDCLALMRARADTRSLTLRQLPPSAAPILSGFTGLEELKISRAELEDLDFLLGMPRLEVLHLQHLQPVADLRPLAVPPRLRVLDLCANPWLDDITFAAAMPRLETLRLCADPVDDISPLSEVSTLRVLELWRAPRSLMPLKGLPLEDVKIREGVSAAALAAALPQLADALLAAPSAEFLAACQAPGPLLSALLPSARAGDCAQAWREALDVTSLRLSTDDLSHISDLAVLPSLVALDLSGLGMRELPPLPDLPHLSTLDVSGNRLRELDLTVLAGVGMIDASQNRLASVRLPEPGLAFGRLDLSDNALRDGAALEAASGTVLLDGNPLQQVPRFAGLEHPLGHYSWAGRGPTGHALRGLLPDGTLGEPRTAALRGACVALVSRRLSTHDSRTEVVRTAGDAEWEWVGSLAGEVDAIAATPEALWVSATVGVETPTPVLYRIEEGGRIREHTSEEAPSAAAAAVTCPPPVAEG